VVPIPSHIPLGQSVSSETRSGYVLHRPLPGNVRFLEIRRPTAMCPRFRVSGFLALRMICTNAKSEEP
jgi:hypothetical protein